MNNIAVLPPENEYIVGIYISILPEPPGANVVKGLNVTVKVLSGPVYPITLFEVSTVTAVEGKYLG